MSRRKKINKFKLAIVVFVLLVFFLSVTGLGRFTYNAVRDRYLSSKKFYFESNLLTSNGSETTYENWDGIGVYEFDIDMYSKNNNLECFGEDLKYSISLEYNDTDILCSIYPDSFKTSQKTTVKDFYTNTESGDQRETIELSNGNEDTFTIYVKPTGNRELVKNDEFEIKVTAFTSEPYNKTLSGKFILKVSDVAFKVTDQVDVPYVIMQVRNTRGYESDVTVGFDESLVRLDLTDNAYLKSTETNPENGVINSVTFTMEKESSKNIKFYKTDTFDRLVKDSEEELLEIFSLQREKNN